MEKTNSTEYQRTKAKMILLAYAEANPDAEPKPVRFYIDLVQSEINYAFSDGSIRKWAKGMGLPVKILRSSKPQESNPDPNSDALDALFKDLIGRIERLEHHCQLKAYSVEKS